jgi:hypothetical protein
VTSGHGARGDLGPRRARQPSPRYLSGQASRRQRSTTTPLEMTRRYSVAPEADRQLPAASGADGQPTLPDRTQAQESDRTRDRQQAPGHRKLAPPPHEAGRLERTHLPIDRTPAQARSANHCRPRRGMRHCQGSRNDVRIALPCLAPFPAAMGITPERASELAKRRAGPRRSERSPGGDGFPGPGEMVRSLRLTP